MATDTIAPGPEAPAPLSPARAQIEQKTLRTDRWWLSPLLTMLVLVAFIFYATFRAFQNADYYTGNLISPFYSPCIATKCVPGSSLGGFKPFGDWWSISPALLILIFPLGFRMTCYYYRKAYYRAFWQSPPACAVSEPHGKYTGERRFPLILNNSHRYFFYAGLVFNVILTWDAILAFRNVDGAWGHMSLGTLVLLANAALLWLYSASCHSCRHIMGGKLKHFSKHPLRYKGWTLVSKLNHKHMLFAWVSLFGVALTDAYVALVANGTFSNPTFF
ncbi:hypothetical protein KGQ20_43140 [Catenulispora sp. NF23]|uniref:Integral membrane protein n=1 Tax=Catenulispora pinistramenti TaxID=2705254 RepID=A0ABS5L7U1_9ACTN|nr:hypothetical protein [Catenulispora pinistramenti]MBS2539558.1 hypothetical protein [Catenulispora pinistramenti]MBS2554398.1 hypothetical protein [Catenulispora pinistramenti]